MDFKRWGLVHFYSNGDSKVTFNLSEGYWSLITDATGYTFPTAYNFNLMANVNDNSCQSVISGCTDINSYNYNLYASVDDNSCVEYVYGCTNSLSLNYDPQANTDDYSCENVLYGCTEYSSLNYKDALSVSGNKGVTRSYPHTPGIDAVGIVENSETEKFKIGDEVIVSGFDLGMNTSGGFGQYIRVPNKWACHLPNGLSALDSMAIGTAGLTAGLCASVSYTHLTLPTKA